MISDEKKERIRYCLHCAMWIIVCGFMLFFAYSNRFNTSSALNDTIRIAAWISLIITGASGIIGLIALALKKDKSRIAALLCVGISSSVLLNNFLELYYSYTLMSYVMSLLLIMVCVMFLVFAIDIFLRRQKGAEQILKPLSLILAVLAFANLIVTFASIWEFIDLLSLETIIRAFLPDILLGPMFILIYLMLNSEGVLEKTSLRDVKMPRTLILAIIIFMYGLTFLTGIIPYSEGYHDITDNIGYIVLIISGLIFMIYRNVDRLTSVSVMLMGIGLFVILSNITRLFTTDLGTFFIGVLTTVAGIGVMVMCILMYSGDKYNTRRLKVIMLVLVAVYLIPILLSARLHPDGEYLLQNHSIDIMNVFLLVSIFIALSEPSIQYFSVKDRMSYNVRIINNSICNDNDAFIFREDMMKLFDDTYGTMNGDGPLEYEKTIPLNINKTTTDLTLRKWSSDGEIIAEISDKDSTVLQATRFSIVKMVPNGTLEHCSSITFYGRKGFFVIINVVDPDEYIKTNKIHLLFYKIIGQPLVAEENTVKETVAEDTVPEATNNQ